MIVSLCIPTRGRPELLKAAIESARKGAKLPDTKIVIGFDADDETKFSTGETDSIADREDSVGAKYNRLFNAEKADIYVQGVDDLFMPEGWDERLVESATTLRDGIGAIYFKGGAITSGSLPSGFAITHEFLELINGFPEWFPFWWYDTWVHEIAVMTNRIVWADVDVKLISGRGKSRGCRDIAYWQHLFDELRPFRITLSGCIIYQLDEPTDKKALLYYNLGNTARALHQMGSNLRDPMEAMLVEQQQGYDAPADERYLRIKRKAEAWLGRV